MRKPVFALTAALSGLAAVPLSAQTYPATQVDLQLVLAVDVSRSMDYREMRAQREGYVQAFRSPDVQQAITSGAYGRVAVTYIEWSSARAQKVVVPWRVISTPDEAGLFANVMARAPYSSDRRTSISAGLAFAAEAFETSGLQSERRTIDISGDGPNNDGLPLGPIRERVLQRGININGLPVVIDPTSVLGAYGPASIADYYEDCVIGGPGAFIVVVRNRQDFAPAIRRKLVLEIAAAEPQVIPAQITLNDRPKIDCLLAENVRPGIVLPLPPAP